MARKLLWPSGVRPDRSGRSSRCSLLRHLTRNDRHEASGTNMRHPTSQALYAYWNEMRGERIAPQRLEIQPARIGAVLPDTFILERCDSRTFRYRLAGRFWTFLNRDQFTIFSAEIEAGNPALVKAFLNPSSEGKPSSGQISFTAS